MTPSAHWNYRGLSLTDSDSSSHDARLMSGTLSSSPAHTDLPLLRRLLLLRGLLLALRSLLPLLLRNLLLALRGLLPLLLRNLLLALRSLLLALLAG